MTQLLGHVTLDLESKSEPHIECRVYSKVKKQTKIFKTQTNKKDCHLVGWSGASDSLFLTSFQMITGVVCPWTHTFEKYNGIFNTNYTTNFNTME